MMGGEVKGDFGVPGHGQFHVLILGAGFMVVFTL
jgi:hypothetical protein